MNTPEIANAGSRLKKGKLSSLVNALVAGTSVRKAAKEVRCNFKTAEKIRARKNLFVEEEAVKILRS